MRNCLILGSGRSGTSLLAGTLAGAGYYMGDKIMPPTIGNPKGYFEAYDIQNLNEDILSRNMFNRPPGRLGELFFKHIPVKNQRWLAHIPLRKKIDCPPDILKRIKEKTSRPPYCFKDPRFCYTLPVWREYLDKPVFFCVFRHPSDTAESILLEWKREKYLKSLEITRRQIFKLWNLMYSHVLEIHSKTGEWVFLHYNQVFDAIIIDMIEERIGAKVDRSFPERKLHKDREKKPVPVKVSEVYNRLCKRANYAIE